MTDKIHLLQLRAEISLRQAQDQSTQVVYDSTSWNAVPPPLGFDDQAPSSIEGSGHRRFAPTLGSVHYDPATASGGPRLADATVNQYGGKGPSAFP